MADRGRLLAEQMGWDMTILHTVEWAANSFLSPAVAGLLAEHQEASVRELADWCRSRTSCEVSTRVPKGSPSWEIARASKGAEVVLLGSSSVETEYTGPVARRVAEAIRSDVIVVRRQPRVPYRRVVVGIDLSEASARAVDRALELAPEADLTLVFALPTRFESFMSDAGMFAEEIDLARKRRTEAAEEAVAAFSGRWPEARTVVASGPPPDVISETARRRSADLVVVGSRGANATRIVLVGSTPSVLLDSSPCDLAIIRIPADFRRP